MQSIRSSVASTVTAFVVAGVAHLIAWGSADASSSDSSEALRAPWYERVEFAGDVRLRYEGFFRHDEPDDQWRHRMRARIRAGLTTEITSWMRVGFELRSGDPRDPVSDNESYDGGFAMKPISFAEGYVAFDPSAWLDVWVGKFDPKKLWVVSDLHWDDDVTVEGALEHLKFGPLEASLYQYLVEERGRGTDASLIGGQLRARITANPEHEVVFGSGFDAWTRPQHVADLTLDGDLGGNDVTNLLTDDGRLISDFGILNVFATWRYTASEKWPLAMMLYGYDNTGAKGQGADHDLGAFARVQIGGYKQPGRVMARYSFYYSEPDALFYVFTQSDTGRGSDVRGHRFDVRVGFPAHSYANFTWYHTNAVFADVTTLDRWQVDYIITF